MTRPVVKKLLIIVMCISLIGGTYFTNLVPVIAVEPASPGSQPIYDGIEIVGMQWLYKYISDWDRDSVYTFDPNDIKVHLDHGYTNSQQIHFYVSPVQIPPLIPLYRLYKGGDTHDHLYTVDLAEVNHAKSLGYQLDGVAGYVVPIGVDLPNTKEVHRIYLPDIKCHMYTTGKSLPHWCDMQKHNDEGYPFKAFSPYNSSGYYTTVIIGVPGAPRNLTASASSGSQVELSWSPVSNRADEIKIERRTETESFKVVASLEKNKTSYSDKNLTPGTTYYYRISVHNVYGDSAYSNEVSIKTPISITILSPNGGEMWETGNTPPIKWQTSAPGTGYVNLSYSIDEGTSWKSITVLPTTNTGSYSWSSPNVNSNRARIKATWVNTAIATPDKPIVQYASDISDSNFALLGLSGPAPETPSNLTATAVSGSKIDLAWRDNCSYETGFSIERNDGNGFFMLKVVGTDKTFWTDETVQPGKNYTYRIRSWSGGKPSATASNEAHVTTPSGQIRIPIIAFPIQFINFLTAPAAPSGLTASVGAGKVNLLWDDNSNNETGFVLERSEGQNFVKIASLAADSGSYTDTIAPGSYTYRIKSCNGAGESEPSNQAQATLLALNINLIKPITGIIIKEIAPAAPGNLAAQSASSYSVSLTWVDNSVNETGFLLERKTGSSFTTAAVLPPGALGYVDSGLAPSTTYTYRVKALSSTTESEWSNQASAATSGQPVLDKPPGGATSSQQNNQSGQVTVVLHVGSSQYTVNNETKQMDASPVILEGRTMLPIRAVIEALGGSIAWDAAEQKASASLGDKAVLTWVGKSTSLVNGKEAPIDPNNSKVMPVIVPPGRTLLPLRFVTESLGCSVQWDGATQTITVIYPQ